MGHRIEQTLVAFLAFSLSSAGVANAGEDAAPQIEVFKSPTCGCCAKWADHLKANGFRVSVTDVVDINSLKRREGVPAQVASCHTAKVGGYFVEGHVPATDIRRLLRERPDVKGISVPGMPMGAPGMETPNPKPYTVFAIDANGNRTVFSRHP